MTKPYVVSSDLEHVWMRHAQHLLPAPVNGSTPRIPMEPLRRFRETGQRVLKEAFGACDWIDAQELDDGLRHTVPQCPFPVIGIDPAYTQQLSHVQLDITRAVNEHGEDVGYGLRDGGYLDLDSAIADLARRLRDEGQEAIALLDDVIFTGKMVVTIAECFTQNGIQVRQVIAAVAIRDGVDRLRSAEIETRAIRTYSDVVDQICERDFMPGAPLSGRTVQGMYNTGMPYLIPFGDAVRWASFPSDRARQMSAAFIRAAAKIYLAMGTTYGQIPRRIHGVDAEPSELIADVLERALLIH